MEVYNKHIRHSTYRELWHHHFGIPALTWIILDKLYDKISYLSFHSKCELIYFSFLVQRYFAVMLHSASYQHKMSRWLHFWVNYSFQEWGYDCLQPTFMMMISLYPTSGQTTRSDLSLQMSLMQAALARICSQWASLPTTTLFSCWPSRHCSSG